MKKITFLIALGFSMISHAQYNYMSLSFGTSMPLGDYAKTSSLSSNGFAIQGFMGTYSGTYFLTDNIGIGGAIRFASNGLDYDKFSSLLMEQIPNDLPDSLSTVFTIGVWKHVSFLVGPELTIPLGKFNFDAYLRGGLTIVLFPAMQLEATLDNQYYIYNIQADKASFGFDTGVSMRYAINEKYGLRFSVNYFQTTAKGNVNQESSSAIPDEFNYKTTIQTVNAEIGIVYIL